MPSKPSFKIDAEFKSLIPPLSPEEYATLEDNLVSDGRALSPLIVWDGILIDGHNRHEICTKHGLPYEIEELPQENRPLTRSGVLVWIIQNQLGRRNISPFVRTQLAMRLQDLLTPKGLENNVKGGQRGGLAKAKALSKWIKPIDDSDRINTQAAIAKVANVATGTIARVAKITEAHKAGRIDDDTIAALRAGETTIGKVYSEVKREEKKVEHAERVERSRKQPPKILEAAQLVLADPPWRYEHQEAANRDVENQYSTATVEEICSHIPKVADDSILLLWATAPKLLEALQVMDAWGFEYRTHAIWDKEKQGMGYWFRGQHELLLVGTRGKPGCTPEPARVSSVFREPRGRHSAKPTCVYEWIEQAFPELAKLEMYCRTPRAGWQVWGNET